MFRPRIVVAAILLLAVGALAFRMARLENRPMHADEAVQAARSRNLWLKGEYRYDADEFHGPTLNYATLPALWLSGAETFAETNEITYRLVPAVFGAAAILLLLLLGDGLGRLAVLWTALFLAISPAMVFYSRYYIHETLLVFFSLAALGCVWRALRHERHYSQWLWCCAAGAALGLMQATKETAVLSYAAALGAGIVLGLVQRWLPGTVVAPTEVGPFCQNGLCGTATSPEKSGSASQTYFAAIAEYSRRYLPQLLTMAGVALVVAFVLFTSFFTNLDGAVDAVATYLPWLRRAGGQSPHIQPWYFYLERLFWWRPGRGAWWSEGLLLVLATVAFVAALFRPRWLADAGDAASVAKTHDAGSVVNVRVALVRWLGCYTVLLAALYTAIPYKTPWCLLQFLLGLVLLAGVGATVLVNVVPWRPVKAIVVMLIAAGAGQLAWQSYRASFVMPADPKNPYVYAQTQRNMAKLVAKVDELMAAAATGPATPVAVIWSDPYYWPLPWYLRSLPRVGYWTAMPNGPLPPLVIASPEYDERLSARFEMLVFYEIRPGVLGVLWVEKGLWDEYRRRKGLL